MMELASKKNVKMISLFIAAIFVLGVFALSVTQSGLGQSASPTEDSAIGFLDSQIVMQGAPDVATIQADMQKKVEEARKEFDEKSASLSDADKAKLMQEYQTKLQAEEAALVEPLKKKVEAAIDAVGKRKGLSVVVDKNAVVYGGVDVTAEVAAELKKAK